MKLKRNKIIQVKKDGNCFFHCLSFFLKKSHQQIRMECIDYFLKLETFLEENCLEKKNIEKLAKDCVWNKDEFDFIPFIASQLYGRTIHIHQGTNKVSFLQKSKEKDIHLRLQNYHFDIVR